MSIPPPGKLPQHPLANRELVLGDLRIAYQLQRSARRSVGLTVSAQGLHVLAPSQLTLSAIDAILQRKAAWIVRKLADPRLRAPKPLGDLPEPWADGASLDYLGQRLRLQHHAIAGRSARVVHVPADASAPDAVGLLRVGLPAGATTAPASTSAPAQRAILRWLQNQARQHFAQRLDHYAPLLGVRYSALALSSARTRWGSASSSGTIRLNWRLIHLAPELIDYVVAHELSHLREMNHSPRFWAVVASVMPDHTSRRAALKKIALGEV